MFNSPFTVVSKRTVSTTQQYNVKQMVYRQSFYPYVQYSVQSVYSRVQYSGQYRVQYSEQFRLLSTIQCTRCQQKRTKSGNNQLEIKLSIGDFEFGIGGFWIRDQGFKSPIPNTKNTNPQIKITNWQLYHHLMIFTFSSLMQ